MKRLKYAVILLLGLSMATMMTSCKKDNTQLIEGKWKAVNTPNNWDDMLNYVYTFNDGMTNFPDGDYFFTNYEINDNTLSVWNGEDVFIIEKLTNSDMKLVEEGHPQRIWELKKE